MPPEAPVSSSFSPVTPAPPAPLGPRLDALWSFDRTYCFLNHGSFGSCPRAVRAAYVAAQERLESRPIELLGRRIRELLAPSRARVGEFLGMSPGSFGFVTNATEGINSVLRSLEFRPGDELLTTSHVYNAVRNAMKFRARQCGAAYVECPLELPIPSPDDMVAAIAAAITPRTRLAVIDQVSSATALVFPIHRIAALCRERGVELLVDAAHVPGMLPVDVESLGCTDWTGNLHKWCCAPKGTAVLWVAPERRHDVKPVNVSHFLDDGLAEEFDWQGTRDMAAWMAAGAAIDFMGEFGWDRVRDHNHRMATWAQRMLCERWQLDPVSPLDGTLLGSMCTVPVPPEIRTRFSRWEDFQETLYRSHRIEVPVIDFGGRWHVRPSAQVYNTADQYELLAQAVLEESGA